MILLQLTTMPFLPDGISTKLYVENKTRYRKMSLFIKVLSKYFQEALD